VTSCHLIWLLSVKLKNEILFFLLDIFRF
jgi:hypothetical protein